MIVGKLAFKIVLILQIIVIKELSSLHLQFVLLLSLVTSLNVVRINWVHFS